MRTSLVCLGAIFFALILWFDKGGVAPKEVHEPLPSEEAIAAVQINKQSVPPLSGWQRSVMKDGPAIAARWQRSIEKSLLARKSNLPTDLIVGIMLTESMGKSEVQNLDSGATGLLGIKEVVCEELGIVPCDLLNPRENLKVGIGYLEHLQEKYGFEDEELILAYGVGPGRARKIIRKNESGPHRYVQKVNYARKILEMT